MIIVPDSIQSTATIAFDKTWESRLKNLNVSQIKTNFANETNLNKLQYLLAMFGINGNEFDFTKLSPEKKLLLIKNLIKAIRSAGTVQSYIDLCFAFGCTKAIVSYSRFLKYDGLIKYNGMQKYASINNSLLQLGATANFSGTTRVSDGSWTLKFNTQTKYDGTFKYNSGKEYNTYCVDIFVEYQGDITEFKNNFKRVARSLEPMRIYINRIEKIN